MTVDPDGAPIVSGPGYVRRMLDEDGDGVFEKFETLAVTKGIAQGVWFDGSQMWLTVDGAIKRSVSREEGQPFVFEDIVPITTNAEHGSHAIRRSADKKWWYVICGNATQIRPEYYSLPSSPVKEPRAGFLMRFPADVGVGANFAAEIVNHGFRNPYDFDFDADGNAYVYDSDGERDVSLPWYRPTRIFNTKPGDDAGWVSASWKRPASFFDMPTLVGEMGRGSPTGVATCRTNRFGPAYQDAVFVGDWTFGRIGVAKLGKEVQIFAKPTGNFGFAVTDLEFSKDGSLFITTGGRGTEGALYRIWKDGSVLDSEAQNVTLRDAQPNNQLNEQLKKSLVNDLKSNGAARGSAFIAWLDKAETSSGPDLEMIIRGLQLFLGGCDGDRMFAGHQAKHAFTAEGGAKATISNKLLAMLKRDGDMFECARLAGMINLENGAVANALAAIANRENDPVQRIHYLNCLAVAGGKLESDSASGIANGLLRVRREIDAADLPVDRNWKPRMQQLAEALFRDMRIPESIVQNPTFGAASDIWIYDSLPEIFRNVARVKIAAKIEADPDAATKSQLQSISRDPRFMKLLRMFADRDEFMDVVVMSVHRSPQPEDRDLLMRGLKSFSLTVNKASLIGLQKLANHGATKSDFEALLALEGMLGWTNPEISVRDQIVMLLQKWTGTSFRYPIRRYDLSEVAKREQRSSFELWKQHLVNKHSVDIKSSGSAAEMLTRFSKIDFSTGDTARGSLAYKKFQCATCHDGGGQNSGPSLAGIASRFSRDDVLKAIADPNDNVPDRYRAFVVATEDGQLFRGSVVYESMAGILLATETGEVVRVAAEDIELSRKSNESLMPEGLLREATDQDVADLWAWLRSL